MAFRLGAALVVAAAMGLSAPAGAAGASGSAAGARALYDRALERERVVRDAEARPTLHQLRAVVLLYEGIVRRFPGSGYSDNALWQGGNIALLAFERFGQPADRRTAERLLGQLKRGYPSSSLAGRVDDVLDRGEAGRPAPLRTQKLAPLPSKPAWPTALVGPGASRPAPPAAAARASATGSVTAPATGSLPAPGLVSPPASVPPPPPAPALSAAAASSAGTASPGAAAPLSTPTATSGSGPSTGSATPALGWPGGPAPAPGGPVPTGTATVRDVKRSTIDGGVRVTIEMDGESSYHAEEIERPRRVFFDLRNTRTVPSLQDAVLKFGDGPVPVVRFGRHAGNVTRVVFSMDGAESYSVFTLYNPFRMVIDFKAAAAGARAAGGAPAPASPAAGAPAPAVPLVASLPAPALPAASPGSTPPKAPRESEIAPKPITSRALPAAASPLPSGPSANSDGKFSLSRQLGLGISRIVIDAGHGGHDPGAQSTGINESELTLDVALRLGRLLEKEPGMEVVMTRDTDVFVPLEERTAIANREGADLFLSIHANASRNVTARGVETYFLNFASNPEAEAVAARENSASARAMHSLPDIVRAIALNNKIDESKDFADMVQRSMVRRLSTRNKTLRDLGVKQAPFVVLIGASMPSVLAEISFVTNRQEAQLLRTGAYRQQIAESLYDAVVRYQQSLKKWKGGAVGVGARQ